MDNPSPPSRRDVLTAAAGLLVSPVAVRGQGADLSPALRALEAANGGRLGVALLDTRTRRIAGHRLDQRFAMCSTFKLALAALVLREADQGRLALADRVTYTASDLLPVSPVTTRHVKDGGASLGVLAEAAQVTSDNTAANLLLAAIGGPRRSLSLRTPKAM